MGLRVWATRPCERCPGVRVDFFVCFVGSLRGVHCLSRVCGCGGSLGPSGRHRGEKEGERERERLGSASRSVCVLGAGALAVVICVRVVFEILAAADSPRARLEAMACRSERRRISRASFQARVFQQHQGHDTGQRMASTTHVLSNGQVCGRSDTRSQQLRTTA